MNRILLSATFVFALTTGFASAQQPAPADSAQSAAKHHHRHNPHHEAAMLSRRLNLTSDQTAKLEPVLADRDQKLSALHADASLTSQAKHDQMRAIRLDTQQQLSNILTPEQTQKMQSMHRRHGGRDQTPATPSGL